MNCMHCNNEISIEHPYFCFNVAKSDGSVKPIILCVCCARHFGGLLREEWEAGHR